MFRSTALDALDLPALFNASPNPYVLIDRQTTIVAMNSAYLAVTMRSADSLLGRSMFEAFPSDPASVPGRQLRQSLARVLGERRTDHISSIHYPIAQADGTMEDRFWSASHVPVLGPNGEVTHILQHTVDITELVNLRARAHEQGDAIEANVMRRAHALQADNLALGEERSFLRQLFELAPSFIAVMRGPHHVIESANAAYMKLVGHRPVLGREVRAALPELHDQGFFEQLDKAYSSGEAFIGHGLPALLQWLPGAPLEQRHVDFVFQPLRGADGQVYGIFVQGHDITEQYLARQAAVESESRFRTLAHSMPIQVWTALPDGGLDWCNDQTYAYCQLGPDQVLRDRWVGLLHPEDVAAAALAWQRSLQNGDPYHTEFRLRRHDGEYRWHIARALPMLDAAGEVVRWIGTNTDIEDQKAGAALLADLSESLARRVEERTEQLVQAQEALRQSQKMEAIGNLAGGIAHDFNNLLQVIGGNLQLLSRQLAGQAQAEVQVARAMGGVTRGARLAAQLLAFARRQPLDPEVLNVGRLIRGMDDILRGSLGEGIEIDTMIAGGLWNTLVDPGNVEAALLNLAINARDAMEGSGKLTIEAGNAYLDDGYAQLHAEVKPGQYVVIAVSDTGSGMSPEVVSRAFDPFFTTKAEGKGTGLGLSMVYGFVKQSGGHVKVYSEPGNGTTIKLYLPRSTEAEDIPAEIDSGPLKAGTETVLVVEDDEAVRETTVALLSDLGYRVLKARDAESALSIVESGIGIDLLFTDVVMPGRLKSTELARKARMRLPGLAVLFTSGYSENSIVHGGRLDAGVQLIGKPYTREALAHKLRQVLNQERTSFASPVTTSLTPPGRLRVLLCEDDAMVRETLIDVLESLNCDATAAADAAAARIALTSQSFDLLVTDLGLPDEDGLLLAQWARSQQPRLSVVIASGRHPQSALTELPGIMLMPKPFDTDDVARIVARALAERAR